MDMPQDFVRFMAPASQEELDSLRDLYWRHFIPEGESWEQWLQGPDLFPEYPALPSGPKAPLWDEWLCAPSLLPGVRTGGLHGRMRALWAEALATRPMDAEGYVATLQHAGYAHQQGWPFPLWPDAPGGMGWHFSWEGGIGAQGTKPAVGFRPRELSTPAGWELDGARDAGISAAGWDLELWRAQAALVTPACAIDVRQAPFVQIRWEQQVAAALRPFLEWTTEDSPVFDPERRFWMDVPPSPIPGTRVVTMIPVYRHPRWRGTVTRLRVCWGNDGPVERFSLQALFTQYDTRHSINNLNYARACAIFFHWTGDLVFLRRVVNRARLALRHFMREHATEEHRVVQTPWWGHDGRSGVHREPDGRHGVLPGRGIGGNYWDILPFGHRDCYATVHYYDALRVLAELEEQIREHPGWNVPGGGLAFDPEPLEAHAAAVREEANRIFWNETTGRFAAGVDSEGERHDYGFTFLNLEAVHYGLASDEHARRIMSWIAGTREVPGDTSRGRDIYRWRFAPRTTTVRNTDFYIFCHTSAHTVPFGAQVQDGGAVLGFSYYDVMARLAVLGPDDAWARLAEIAGWYREAQSAGGYAAYYAAANEGTLQGAGYGGGLGIDQEFFESVMLPQAILVGFAGFAPTPDGFRLAPRLPGRWPELTVRNVAWRDLVLDITVARGRVELHTRGVTDEPAYVLLPPGEWELWGQRAGEDWLRLAPPAVRPRDGALRIDWQSLSAVRLICGDRQG